ncbi:MAG: peptidyl-prolyl cis-trans isomerase [Planctomycetota bacterium]|nr:peptidyl-prolyl cis-trans isomerase [Planctomycetota bacterium]
MRNRVRRPRSWRFAVKRPHCAGYGRFVQALLCFAAWSLSAGFAVAAAGDGGLPGEVVMGYAAEVGAGRVRVDQVMELWTPVWYETALKVRTGKLDPAEGDQRLQEEWRRALIALVKDELFFQEAEREHNSIVNSLADRIHRMQAPDSYQRTRGQIAEKIRKDWDLFMERDFRQLTSEVVKRSGGMLKLQKVLEGRGVTYQDWQTRLRKKAFTNTYLNMLIRPRAPEPGPKRIQDYYARHPDEFSKPGLVRFSHIFFSNARRGGEDAAREAAAEVWGMLVDGEVDFAEAASRFSDDPPGRERNGLETEYEAEDPEREAWLGDIRIALREEAPGALAPILESPFGFHLAVLHAIGPERKIPFQEVRKDIEKRLADEVWEAEVDKYFHVVRKNIAIRVLMPEFPPALSCSGATARNAVLPSYIKVDRGALPGMDMK